MNQSSKIAYYVVLALLALCRILPERLIHAIFRALGHIGYALLGRRRRSALRNTEIAFPEKSLADRRRIVRRNFINLCDSMALNALIMSGRISNERLMSMVETEGWEHIEKVLQGTKTGIQGFSAHVGNWELMPQYVALRLQKPIVVVARQSNNELLEERVVKPLRERFGVQVIYKKNAIMRLVKAIKGGALAGLLVDQRLNLREGIPVEFFGREAGTTATPALLQIRFNFPTLPLFMIRTGHQRYRLVVGQPVEWSDNGKPMEEQVAKLTHIHQKIVEEMIRRYPDQWFWAHNRWGLKKDEI